GSRKGNARTVNASTQRGAYRSNGIVVAACRDLFARFCRFVRSTSKQTEQYKNEKETSTYEHLCRDLIAGLDVGMPKYCCRSEYGISEGKPADASRIQSKNCDYAQTATASQRPATRQSFDCRIRREIVLRISNCYKGPDPGWQPNPVQCLQTVSCGIWTDDEPRFCRCNARSPSCSHSAIRRLRSPRGVIENSASGYVVPLGTWVPFAIATRKSTIQNRIARVAKLADAPDLGSGGEILRGSSPLPGTHRESRAVDAI